jgi:hypothetical protein
MVVHPEAWIVPAALLKGMLMALVVLGVAELPFVQAIIVACCSATITGVFLVFSAWVSTRRTITRVDEVASKVEAVQEETGGAE